ncbi:MAG: hypothetical protein LBH44_04590 [Treponema sp.]|jgi:hypothetical protein|nr:hypothetical protein [Treponema sp.]
MKNNLLTALQSMAIIAAVTVIGFTFTACDEPGNDTPPDTNITLSGTITIKNNGQPIPFVEIDAHTEDWSWRKLVKLSSSEPNAPWSIITEPFSSPTNIIFTVRGYSNNNYDFDGELFVYNVDGLSKTVHNKNVSNIVIDLSNLKFITLSGTFSLDYGKPIPSLVIQAVKKNSWAFLGSTTILSPGDNAPWSIMIPEQDADTDVLFQIIAFDGPIPWVYDWLFDLEYILNVKVKDQDITGITFKFITLSGTFNYNYNGNPIPSVHINISKKGGSGLGGTTILQAGNNTPWSVVIPAQDADTDVVFNISGWPGSVPSWTENGDLFGFWNQDFGVKVKDQNITGITLNLGNIDP